MKELTSPAEPTAGCNDADIPMNAVIDNVEFEVCLTVNVAE